MPRTSPRRSHPVGRQSDRHQRRRHRVPMPVRTATALTVIAALLVAGQAAFGRSSSPHTINVHRGDTLWALAQRYGVDMRQLASSNHMRVNDVLFAGRTLILPAGAKGGPSQAPTTTGKRAKPTTDAVAPAADPRLIERTFCSTFKAPTGPQGQLPADLRSDPSRLALRPVFAKWARVYSVPLDLIEAEAWQESGWNNSAVSPDHALGIGQLLPSTAVFVNQTLGTNLSTSVPADNIRMMAAFLGSLLRAAGGQVCGAVAAYYQGFATLQRYGVLPVSQIYVRSVLSLRPRFR